MENGSCSERVQEDREITIHLKVADLVPDEAEVAQRCSRLREEAGAATAYCLGWLMANIEGIARAIDDGDGQRLAWHIRAGLGAIAAYEAVRQGE